ncbi:MAG: hypothetical protein U0835_22595 [Isosphaeraceae bacterium]
MAFLPDGRRLLTAGGDRVLKLWDVQAGVVERTFEGHPGALLSVAVSPDGRFAVAGSGHYWASGWRNADYYGMHMWDLASGQVVGCLETPCPISAVTFSDDSRRLVAGGEDRVVRSWDLPDPATLVSRRLTEAPTASRISAVEPDKG